MKSTVEITASPSANRYTAASSLDSIPTSKFASDEGGRSLSASDRTVGLIFAAQPQVRESPVRVFFLPNSISIPFLDANSVSNDEASSFIDGMSQSKVKPVDQIVKPYGLDPPELRKSSFHMLIQVMQVLKGVESIVGKTNTLMEENRRGLFWDK